MEYRVVITASAEQDFREYFEWIRERSVQGADNWRSQIIAAVRSLGCEADRHALARESAAFPVSIRCLVVGKRRSSFRIFFHSVEKEVRVLAIRRSSRDLIEPDDLRGL